MSYEPHLYRSTQCAQCGTYFMDDCGDVFCSGSCEEQWESEHTACERCGEQVGDDNLVYGKYCEPCMEEMEDDE